MASGDKAARRRRVTAAVVFFAAAVGVSAGGFFGAQEASPPGTAIAATTVNVACGQTIPQNVAAGTTVHVAGPCVYHRTDAIRIPNNFITYEFEAGVVLDGDRLAGNAFYVNGGDDATIKSLDPANRVRMIEFAKSVIYTSTADRFQLLSLYTGHSGSDAALDHGLYIDKGTGWLIRDHISENMTSHGIQIYSGSGGPVTGRIEGAKLFSNGRDGLHVGAGSVNLVATRIDSHHNGNWGIRFYAGTGTQVPGPNWLYGNAFAPFRVDRSTAQPNPFEWTATPPTEEPPPPPPPPPPPACDQACVDAYEAQLAAYKTQVASLQSALDAERATTAALRARLAQIHELSGVSG